MTRKIWTQDEKLAIVLEMLKGQEKISSICKRNGVADSQAYKWRDEALEGMKTALTGKHKSPVVSNEADRDRLLKIIGQQAVAIDYQKKLSAQISR